MSIGNVSKIDGIKPSYVPAPSQKQGLQETSLSQQVIHPVNSTINSTSSRDSEHPPISNQKNQLETTKLNFQKITPMPSGEGQFEPTKSIRSSPKNNSPKISPKKDAKLSPKNTIEMSPKVSPKNNIKVSPKASPKNKSLMSSTEEEKTSDIPKEQMEPIGPATKSIKIPLEKDEMSPQTPKEIELEPATKSVKTSPKNSSSESEEGPVIPKDQRDRYLLQKDSESSEAIVREHLPYAECLTKIPDFYEALHTGINVELSPSEKKAMDQFRTNLNFDEVKGVFCKTIEEVNGVFCNRETGTMFYLKEVIKGNEKELVLCFSGLGGMRNQIDKKDGKARGLLNQLDKSLSDPDTKSAIKDFLGLKTDASKEAMKIGNEFKKLVDEFAKNTDIGKGNVIRYRESGTIVGHSHGGALAQCAAMSSGLRGVVFNSRPVGAWARKQLEVNGANTPEITAFVNSGDWVSDTNGAVQILANGSGRLFDGPHDLSTVTYVVPKPETKQSAKEWHNNLLKSFLSEDKKDVNNKRL